MVTPPISAKSRQPARTADQDRYAAGASWPLRHIPDGCSRTAASGLRGHPRPDQHLARATGHHGVCMTGGRSRPGGRIICDRTGAPEHRRNGAEIGRRGPLSRSSPPVPTIPPPFEAEDAWKLHSGGRNLTGERPNGICRLMWLIVDTMEPGNGRVGIGSHHLRNWQINQPTIDYRGKWHRTLPEADVSAFDAPEFASMLRQSGYDAR